MPNAAAERCRGRFLRFFPGGFADETYLDWERNYKGAATRAWAAALSPSQFRRMLQNGQFREIAATAVGIESRTNLLFSFEKMALRDATRSSAGARQFVEELYDLLHGTGRLAERFTQWIAAVTTLPRRQTRVLTWPVVTVFPFIAQPTRHIFLKPNVTRIAAARYGADFEYHPRPTWYTYQDLLRFARLVRNDVRDLHPRDLIDIQSFLWVQGSDEYGGRAFKPAQTTRVRL